MTTTECQTVKCPCNNCSEVIEFSASRAGEVMPCPHCGLDTKLFIHRPPLVPRPKKSTRGMVIGVGLGALIIGAILSIKPGSRLPVSEEVISETMVPLAPPVVLKTLENVEISFSDDVLLVRNQGQFRYRSFFAWLNEEPPDGYQVEVNSLGPGDAVHIPLANFVRNNGLRFNPRAFKVMRVWAGGNGYQYKEYE